jgi:hypothetical protein
METLKHDHARCTSLTNHMFASASQNVTRQSYGVTTSSNSGHQNVLLYGRKTEDLSDVMNAMVECVEHIILNSGKDGRAKVTGLYMEDWALDLISVHTDLMEKAVDHSITLIRWAAGATSSNQPALVSEAKNEFGTNAMNAEFQRAEQKTFQDFSFVYCIGGDGTLLRLLRVLFYKCFPPTLPKIITFSMGSLNYLCNFDIKECKKILNATALAKSYEDMDN